MNNYVIFADSACDINPQMLEEWGVKYTSLFLTFDNDSKEYSNNDISTSDFYARMKDGEFARTSAANAQNFRDAFTPELNNGNDIFYLAFSSRLSTTCNSGKMAAQELAEEFPGRKITVVDSLSASAGYGLLLNLAVKKKENGASIDELAEYIESIRLNICHWFTVDDLKYLKRGGRISSTVAFVGTVLGIKPVMHMDNEGYLVSVGKVRGRKTALQALVDKMDALAVRPITEPVFISNGDCSEDADELAKLVKEKLGVNVELIADIGPVIGAHSGPGTIALFFVGKER